MAKYSRLCLAERRRIEQLRNEGRGVRAIATAIGRSPSTVSHELRRVAYDYKAQSAERDAKRKQSFRKTKRKISGCLEEMLLFFMLEKRWSPEQISGFLRKSYPDYSWLNVSAEAIYLWVYRHEKRKVITTYLRRKHRSRKTRSSKRVQRGGIRNRVSIRERPEVVDNRLQPGHWEGDLIIGARNQSAIGTLVERHSRYTILVKLDNRDSETVTNGFLNALKRLPPSLRRSLTYDNGSEMAYHETLTRELGLKVYFADPRSPWQRGSNENTNGLIREFFPKGTDLSEHSVERLAGVSALLNQRPRKILKYEAPADLFDLLCEQG